MSGVKLPHSCGLSTRESSASDEVASLERCQRSSSSEFVSSDCSEGRMLSAFSTIERGSSVDYGRSAIPSNLAPQVYGWRQDWDAASADVSLSRCDASFKVGRRSMINDRIQQLSQGYYMQQEAPWSSAGGISQLCTEDDEELSVGPGLPKGSGVAAATCIITLEKGAVPMDQ